ncbi:MAG: hypothetical protein IT577_15255 [Verrucomicrobiae bacterium]|nr:hypothetical protein [Verrucomicrobiae bacterium]
MSGSTGDTEMARFSGRDNGTAYGAGHDGPCVVAPVDPDDERLMWLSLDPSEAAEQLPRDHGRPPARRRSSMQKKTDEITADRLARDGHAQQHAAAPGPRVSERRTR